MANAIPDQVFEGAGFRVHHWAGLGRDDIQVLHKEPFKFTWFATQVVTFVFLIRRPIESLSQALGDYPALRKFAGEHKRTILPFMFQCGYALLPIYMAETFPRRLIEETRWTYKKRWCVFSTPSLFDTSSGRVITLDRKYLWGCVYRDYLRATIYEVANLVGRSEASVQNA